MDESAPIQEFLRRHLFVILLGIVGAALLLYGFTLFDTQDQQKVIFTAGSDTINDQQTRSEASIIVDVSGAVNKPGVHKLKEQARVQDAIHIAGGMTADADQAYIAKQINLAAKVTDGTKIYIPFVGEVLGTSEGKDGSTGSGININTASSKELDNLPGVGSVTSEKIISGRPFSGIEELVKKKIVTQKVFDGIKDKITVY